MPKIGEDKKAERKDLIVKAGMECFSAKGYAKTTMDDIVKTSGISKGGIYLYFKSKDEVFREIADEVIAKRKSMLDELDDEMNYSDQIKEYIKKIISNYNKTEYKKKIRFSFEFWVENKDKKNLGDVSKKKYLDERFLTAFNDVNSILKKGIEIGEFRKDIDTKTLIYILFATIDGMAFFTGILGKPNPKNSPQMIADIFEKYIVKN